MVDFLPGKAKPLITGLIPLSLLFYFLLALPASCGAGKDLSVMHLTQIHRVLGKLEVYFDADHLKVVNKEGDLTFLWKKGLNSVYVLNPQRRMIFIAAEKDFLAHGSILTGNSSERTYCLALKNRRNIRFLRQEAVSVEVCGEVFNQRSGPKKFVHCQDLVGLASSSSPLYRRCVAVLTILYGMAVHEFMPLKYIYLYEPKGGEVWFQTNVVALKPKGVQQTYTRVNTLNLRRENVAASFFAVPQTGYKLCKTQAEVIGSSQQAEDFSQMFSE